MKRFHTLIGIVLSLTMLMVLSGCGSATITDNEALQSADTSVLETIKTPTTVDSPTVENTEPETEIDSSTTETIETPTDIDTSVVETTEPETDEETPTAETTEPETDTDSSSYTPVAKNFGTVTLSLTDAPADDEVITGVFVTFTGLRYQYADTNESNESDENWEDVNLSEPRTVDLLALQNGNTTLLDQTDLPSGTIDHVRFVLDTENCYVELEGNITEKMIIPSGNQTGYKAIGGFTVPTGGVVNVTADFDLRKSLVINKKKYLLKPTIKIIDNIEVGEASGMMSLDANGSKVIVYAYEDGSWDSNESNATNNFGNAVISTDATDGNYTLPWLTVGTYDLVIVAYNNIGEFENILGYINDVIIVTGETITQDITDDTLLDALP